MHFPNSVGMASYSALTVLEGLDKDGNREAELTDCLIGVAFECGANFYSEEIVLWASFWSSEEVYLT